VRDRRSENIRRYLARVWADPAASPLRVRRLAADLSQVELAQRAGLSWPTVHRAERGETVSADSWSRLASVLACGRADIDPDYRRTLAPWTR
jgi:transcriptional regulator with XRE-family HTH domain